MHSVGVFCGSAAGKNPSIRQVTEELGRHLAKEGTTVVYGGASVGLMGVLADSTLKAGGKVIGVIPKAIERREIVHRGLTELIETESLHERKAKMADLSDAFLILPGGTGTLNEFFEVLAWAQLGLHKKPIGILNVCGYYDAFLSFFDRALTEQFIWQEHKRFWLTDDDPKRLLKNMETYTPPNVDTWIRWDQT